MTDARSHAEPRRHHQVPQFLLRAFGTERRPGRFQIQAYDKWQGRRITSAIENLAVESDFNSLDRDGVRISLEEGMGLIESAAAPPIREINESASFNRMSIEDRASIDLFCALQFLRGTGLRAQFSDMSAQMREWVGRVAAANGAGFDEPEEATEDLKGAAFQIIARSLLDFSRYFDAKDLLLFEAPAGEEFLIGDNPIAMQNAQNFGAYGNIGLMVPGIEVYVPISSRLTLAWCPSILPRLRSLIDEADARLAPIDIPAEISDDDLAETRAARTRLAQIVELSQTGNAIPSEVDNVTRLNSLQVKWAERWVMAGGGNFEIVERMIGDNDAIRTGKRISVV